MPIGLGGNGIWGGKEDDPTPPTPPTPTDPVQLVKSCAFTHGYSRYYTLTGATAVLLYDFVERAINVINESAGTCSFTQTTNVTKDHKYLVAVGASDTTEAGKMYTSIEGIASTKTLIDYSGITSFLFTAGNTGDAVLNVVKQEEGDSVNVYVTFALVFDLTAQFGAGFEPVTADAFLEAMHVDSFYNLLNYEPLEDTPIVNIVSNPLFANGLTGWTANKATAIQPTAGGVVNVTATATKGGLYNNCNFTKDHKYMIGCYAEGYADGTAFAYVNGVSSSKIALQTNGATMFPFDYTDNDDTFGFYVFRDENEDHFETKVISEGCIFDTTAMFGAGNEPNTADKFLEYLGVSYLSDIEIPQPLTITAPSAEETNNE